MNFNFSEPTKISATIVSIAVDSVTDLTAMSIPPIFFELPSVISLLSPFTSTVAVVLVPVINVTT